MIPFCAKGQENTHKFEVGKPSFHCGKEDFSKSRVACIPVAIQTYSQSARRHFRVVHISAIFVFSKYPRKYVERENNIYIYL